MLPLLFAMALVTSQSAREVAFTYRPGHPVQTVAVVGSFNDWDAARDPLSLQSDGKTWRATVRIEPGVYSYLFVEDGSRWLPDRSATPSGDSNDNTNSKLVVLPPDFDLKHGRKGDGQITASALRHRPDRSDCFRYDARTFRVRLRTRHADVERASTVVGRRKSGMEIIETDDLYDTWQGELAASALTNYRFIVEDGTKSLELGPYRQNAASYPLPKPPKWPTEAVFYQIFPERFANGEPANDGPGIQPWGSKPTGRGRMGGDLNGILAHIDHLKELGISGLYLNPIFEALSNHAYDTVDYLHVDHRFGTDTELRKLVEACHKARIRVMLDGVFNHSSPEFFAFRDVREKGADSKFRDWYYALAFPIEVRGGQKTYKTFAGVSSMPKLNSDNPEVREYCYRVGTKWIHDAGIDAWRLDVGDGPSHDFWRGFREAIKESKSDTYVLGEIWGDAHEWLQGDEFDATMNYRWRNAVLDFVRDRIKPNALDRQLRLIRETCPAACLHSMYNLLGSHDTERVRTLLKGDAHAEAMAVALQFTYPGVPSVYYGDEIGMEGGKDPDDRRAMIWDRSKWNMSLFTLHKRLIAMRNQRKSLTRGDLSILKADDRSGVFAFQRRYGKEKTIAIFNRGTRAVDWRGIVPGASLLLSSATKTWTETVPPGGYAILDASAPPTSQRLRLRAR